MRHILRNLPYPQRQVSNLTVGDFKRLFLEQQRTSDSPYSMVKKFNNVTGISALPIQEGKEVAIVLNDETPLADIKADVKTSVDVYMRKYWDYWGTDPEFQILKEDGTAISANQFSFLVERRFLDGCSATGEWRNENPCSKKELLIKTAVFVLTYFSLIEERKCKLVFGEGTHSGGTGQHVWFELPPWWGDREKAKIDEAMTSLTKEVYKVFSVSKYRESHGYGLEHSGNSRYDRPFAMEFRRLPSLMCSPVLFILPFYYGQMVKTLTQEGKTMVSVKHSIDAALEEIRVDFPELKPWVSKYKLMFKKGWCQEKEYLKTMRWDEWTEISGAYAMRQVSQQNSVYFNTDRLFNRDKIRRELRKTLYNNEKVDYALIGLSKSRANSFVRVTDENGEQEYFLFTNEGRFVTRETNTDIVYLLLKDCADMNYRNSRPFIEIYFVEDEFVEKAMAWLIENKVVSLEEEGANETIDIHGRKVKVINQPYSEYVSPKKNAKKTNASFETTDDGMYAQEDEDENEENG